MSWEMPNGESELIVGEALRSVLKQHFPTHDTRPSRRHPKTLHMKWGIDIAESGK